MVAEQKERMVSEPEEELQSPNANDDRSLPGDVKIPNRIFVKGFPRETQDEELKEFFEIYGIVHDANIVKTEDGMNRGFAFVTFDSQEIAEKVIDMGVIPYKDRNLVIGSAKIRERKPIHVFSYSQASYPAEQYMVVPQDQLLSYYVKPDGSWIQVPPFSQAIPVMANATKGSCYQIEHAPPPYHYENCIPSTQMNQPQTEQNNVSPYSLPVQNNISPLPNNAQVISNMQPVTQTTPISYCHVMPPQDQTYVPQVMKTQTNVNYLPQSPAFTNAYPVYINGIADGMGNLIITDQPNYVTYYQNSIETPYELRNLPVASITSPVMTTQPTAHSTPSPPARVHFDNVIQYDEPKNNSRKKEMMSNIMYVETNMKSMKFPNHDNSIQATPVINAPVKAA